VLTVRLLTPPPPPTSTITPYTTLFRSHFTSSDTQAVLPANYTFTAGDNGVHTFSATLKTAGSRSLTATDTITGTITGAQTITVQPGRANILTPVTFPSRKPSSAPEKDT